MSNVTEAARELIDAMTNVLSRDEDAMPDLAVAVQEAAERAGTAEITDAATIIAGSLPDVSTADAGFVAVILGALLEHGADPAVAEDAVLARLPEMLELTVEFIEACEEYAEEHPVHNPDGDDDAAVFGSGSDDEEGDDSTAPGGLFEGMELPDGRYVPAIALDAVSMRLPEAAAAFASMDRYAMGAIALLSRRPSARRRARRNPDLHEMAERVGENFLWMMLQVLDDEPLIVLHPARGRGYRVEISGISDNFQLHTLLAAELIGDEADGWLPGETPDPSVIAVARGDGPQNSRLTAQGVWNLYNWVALKPDGTLSEEDLESSEGWIWGEGIPADILPFDGARVVLLGPPPYARTWSASRVFEGMRADLKVMEQLGTDTVADWLSRIRQAPR